MPAEQEFLITVRRMCKCDEVDLVPSWSGVVAEKDLPNITLADAAKLTALVLEGFPGTNVRPMTEAEIAEWRREQ
jgi:hypothetical protein